MTDNKGLVWIPPCGRTVAKHPQEAGYRCFGGRSWQSRASIGSLAGCYNSVLRKKGAAGAGHWEFSDGDPCQRPRAMVSLGTTQPHGQDRSRSRTRPRQQSHRPAQSQARYRRPTKWPTNAARLVLPLSHDHPTRARLPAGLHRQIRSSESAQRLGAQIGYGTGAVHL